MSFWNRRNRSQQPPTPGIILLLVGMLMVAWLGTAPRTSAQESAPLATTTVDARQGWQWSGVWLDRNTEITIEVIGGQWTPNRNSVPYSQGEGGSYICAQVVPAHQCLEPLPHTPQGALIGRVGAAIFPIGNATRFVVPLPGTLDLRINDHENGLDDNEGILTVRISLTPSTRQPGPQPAPVAPSPVPQVSSVVTIGAQQGWQWANVWLAGNTTLTIEVSGGQWTHNRNSEPYNQGEGGAYICANVTPANQCFEPLPQAPQGALIGRIGSYVFPVGRGTQFVVSQSGTLDLRINEADNALDDNAGALIVRITR